MARDRIHVWSVQLAERWLDYRRRHPDRTALPALKRAVRSWVQRARRGTAHAQPANSATPQATDHAALRRRWAHQVRFLHAELLSLDGKRLESVDVERTEDTV